MIRLKELVSLALHHPDRVCYLGMTVLALVLMLHMVGLLPEADIKPMFRAALSPAVAAEKGPK